MSETISRKRSKIQAGKEYTIIGNELMNDYTVEGGMKFVGKDRYDKRFYHFARKRNEVGSPIELITIKGSDIESIEGNEIRLSLGYAGICPIDENDFLYDECMSALRERENRRQR